MKKLLLVLLLAALLVVAIPAAPVGAKCGGATGPCPPKLPENVWQPVPTLAPGCRHTPEGVVCKSVSPPVKREPVCRPSARGTCRK